MTATYHSIPPIPPEDFRELVLSGSKNLDELTYIRHLNKRLEVLRFDETNVEDLSPISDFKKLKKLTFNFTKVEQLDQLGKLTKWAWFKNSHFRVTVERRRALFLSSGNSYSGSDISSQFRSKR